MHQNVRWDEKNQIRLNDWTATAIRYTFSAVDFFLIVADMAKKNSGLAYACLFQPYRVFVAETESQRFEDYLADLGISFVPEKTYYKIQQELAKR
jgi:hypothetical protein